MSDTEEFFAARVTMTEDGSLKNRRHEGMALLMAEGLSKQDAWTLIDGDNSKTGSRKMRERILAHPVFKMRLETLMTEKEDLEKDPVFGQTLWMAQQLWRQAVAIGDVQLMERAAKLRFEVSKQMAASRPSGLPGTPPTKGPGAPVAENTQARQSAAGIRENLMRRGMKMDPKPEDEDADAA